MNKLFAALVCCTFSSLAWADISNTASCAFSDSNGVAQPSVLSNTVTVTVTSSPTMKLVKSAAPTSVGHGGIVTFTIAYTNTSSVSASGVTITDGVPAGSTLVQGSVSNGGFVSGTSITWTLGTVGAGASGSVTFQVTAD